VSSGRLVAGGVELTGGDVGSALPDASEAADWPPAERATTVTVYAVPVVPPSTQEVSPAESESQVDGPGEAVAR
jgi:hypothetical protein